MAGVEEPFFFRVFRQIELHAVGVDAPANRLTELLTPDEDLTPPSSCRRRAG